MIISHYAETLRKLLDQARESSDAPQVLGFFVAARVVADRLDVALSGSEDAGKDYTLEKLSLFINYFEFAAIPCPGDEKSPEEWLEAAHHNLFKVETLHRE